MRAMDTEAQQLEKKEVFLRVTQEEDQNQSKELEKMPVECK